MTTSLEAICRFCKCDIVWDAPLVDSAGQFISNDMFGNSYCADNPYGWHDPMHPSEARQREHSTQCIFCPTQTLNVNSRCDLHQEDPTARRVAFRSHTRAVTR